MKVLVERLTYLFVVFYVGSSVYMSIPFWLKDFHLNIQFCFYPPSHTLEQLCMMEVHYFGCFTVFKLFGTLVRISSISNAYYASPYPWREVDTNTFLSSLIDIGSYHLFVFTNSSSLQALFSEFFNLTFCQHRLSHVSYTVHNFSMGFCRFPYGDFGDDHIRHFALRFELQYTSIHSRVSLRPRFGFTAFRYFHCGDLVHPTILVTGWPHSMSFGISGL